MANITVHQAHDLCFPSVSSGQSEDSCNSRGLSILQSRLSSNIEVVRVRFFAENGSVFLQRILRFTFRPLSATAPATHWMRWYARPHLLDENILSPNHPSCDHCVRCIARTDDLLISLKQTSVRSQICHASALSTLRVHVQQYPKGQDTSARSLLHTIPLQCLQFCCGGVLPSDIPTDFIEGTILNGSIHFGIYTHLHPRIAD